MAWFGIFSPGIMLKTAIIPIWTRYRSLSSIKTAMKGINSIAVGLVYAAVYFLWNSAISDGDKGRVLGAYPSFVVISAFTFVSVGFSNVPAPVAILLGGMFGYFSKL